MNLCKNGGDEEPVDSLDPITRPAVHVILPALAGEPCGRQVPISPLLLQCRPSRSFPDDTQVFSSAPGSSPSGSGTALSFLPCSLRTQMVKEYLFLQGSVAHTRSQAEGSLAHPSRRWDRFPVQAATEERTSAGSPGRRFHSV